LIIIYYQLDYVISLIDYLINVFYFYYVIN